MVTVLKPYLWTVGRRFEEKADILITDPYLNDYNKVLQSKAFRRLASKTQVMYRPGNPHVRTRRVHSDEVISTVIPISLHLGLNVHMCMAIAAGHDIGHTPAGHLGEKMLGRRAKLAAQNAAKERGDPDWESAGDGVEFRHYVNSVVVAQHVERRGQGLNLCYETLEGMLMHSRGEGEMTLSAGKPEEYNVVMYSDKIAYTFSDVNDAIRDGRIKKRPSIVQQFGKVQRERNNTTLMALIEESREKGKVEFRDSKWAHRFAELRAWMYKNVYSKIDDDMQQLVLNKTYDFFERRDFGVHPALLVSLMTDEELDVMARFFMRQREPKLEQIDYFGVFEILPYIKGKNIDFTDPDLGWKEQAVR